MVLNCIFITFRLLFFSTYNPTRVYKASLDGTTVTQIVSGLGDVCGLDIDICANIICWADHAGKRIECSNYMGDERRELTRTTGKPWGVAIQDGVAYYTTGTPNRVSSLPLTGGNVTILDIGTFNTSSFYGIAILHRGHHCIPTGIWE
ncbi:hypothetical protein NP493_101g04037 [Ridgeia piscesae]|uniref:Uncharacterized protein n=1 Tax=Ridgeia piscesae TaxID=27915 RepID=A0AAD9P7I0_RIDPI|nr:hypothetical protein NP493_101g04037 [Ridgeia piscesae]